LKWDNLNLGNVSFDGIDDPFSEEEVLNAISQMSSHKAHDPDGFAGAFFKKNIGASSRRTLWEPSINSKISMSHIFNGSTRPTLFSCPRRRGPRR
jgi:hypothetical protein